MHRIITRVKTKEDLLIEAVFADGEIVIFDVKTLFEKYPVFKELNDRELFNNVKVDGVGYGVSWNDEIDLSSDGIYLRGDHIGKTDPDARVMLAQGLAQAREEKGISQRQLAKSSGVIQAEISKIEQGKGNPTISTLQKLAKSLGRTVASLLL